MAKKPQLDLEDAIVDDFARQKDFDYLELPLSRQAFGLVIVLAGIFGAIVIGRLIFLNVIKGDFYKIRAAGNAHKEVIIPAYRGAIVDRFDKIIAANAPSFSVYLDINKAFKDGSLESAVKSLSEVLEIAVEEINQNLAKIDLEKNNLVLIARNITTEQAIALKSLNLPSVAVVDDYKRDYVGGPAFAHVIGYSGGSVKSGIEAIYDDYLKGNDGRLIVFRDALGNEIDRKRSSEPVVGHKLVATIDADLQKFFYDRMLSGLRFLGRDSGVGIALNPQSGEVLAMISLPSFDNNLFAVSGFNNEKKRLLEASNKPLFNRAVSGLYTPGSTIKPLVALAALREKIVTPAHRFFSAGFIEIPNVYNPEKPSRFLDWKPHGWVDLRSALAKSSNIYFYAIGGGFENFKGLGIGKLLEYWRRFLLGRKTGIDLPAENDGFLPSPEEKESRTGDIWRIGDTYNVSIGQGDLLLTPLQLINFTASIANGGKIYRPFVVKQIVSHDGEIILENKPEVLLDYSDWQAEIKEVQRGLEDAVSKSYGTANLLSLLPLRAAGKTGSAQVANNTRTNAFFAGYFPADQPQIAILVLIENSREGSLNAVPIAKDVFEWYYYNRIAK